MEFVWTYAKIGRKQWLFDEWMYRVAPQSRLSSYYRSQKKRIRLHCREVLEYNVLPLATLFGEWLSRHLWMNA